MQPLIDVLVAGGGPVGLAVAICAAQRGLQVVVLEQDTAPWDKCCGEGIMPAGVRALAKMGVDFLPEHYAPLQGIQYVDGPHHAKGLFVQGLGRGIRRVALMAALARRASTLGVRVLTGCRVHHFAQDGNGITVDSSAGCWAARTLVGADGLHSRLRRAAQLDLPVQPGPRRFGVRQHFAVPPWSPYVQVHWATGCEAYVTPVAADTVGVAFLWGPEPLSYAQLLARFPAIRQRLQGAIPTSRLRGAGSLYQPVRRRVQGRLALVGDAAGYCDALTGEGLTLGFRSAQALVEIVAADAPLADYEGVYRRLSAPYYRETAWLLALAARPRLRRGTMRLLARYPRLLQACVAAHSRPF